MQHARIGLIGFVSRCAVASLLVAGMATANTGDPFPPVPFPTDNPQTAAKVALGKELFWSLDMSSNRTMACGTCHTPEAGASHPLSATNAAKNPGADGIFNTADDVFGSIGIQGQTTGRQAPNNFNVMYQAHQFWDRRAGPDFFDPENPGLLVVRNGSMEKQATGPIGSNIEMAFENVTFNDIKTRVAGASGPISGTAFPTLFGAAFNGDTTVTIAKIGLAVAAYERTLLSDQTPFARFSSGELGALTAAQEAGFDVFRGAGRCNKCHNRGANFSDGQVHNVGVSPIEFDRGVFNITARPQHLGAFKTPVLYGLGRNAPYFHGGQALTVDDVVAFYDRGGDFHVNQDALIRPLGLSALQLANLSDFLRNVMIDPRAGSLMPFVAAVDPFDHPDVTMVTATPADVTPPTVMFTSPSAPPFPTLNGMVKFVASATDDQNVKQVEFFLNGSSIKVDFSRPYDVVVNTTLLGMANTIEAQVRDFANPLVSTGAVAFTVDQGAADSINPEVTITAPTGKTPVGGVIKLAATAFDNIGVTRVDYTVDGNPAGSGFPPSFAATVNSLSPLLADGTHTFAARAFDGAGRMSSLSSVMAQVDNAPGFTKASLPIEADGVTTSGLGEFVATGTFTATQGSLRVQAFEFPPALNPSGRFTVILRSPLGDVTFTATLRVNAAGNGTVTLRTLRGDFRKEAFWGETVDILDGANLIAQGNVGMELLGAGAATVPVRFGTLRVSFRTTIETETLGPNEGSITGIITATRVPQGEYVARFTGPLGDFDVGFSPDVDGIVEAELTFPREDLAKALAFTNALILQNGVQVGTARIRIR